MNTWVRFAIACAALSVSATSVQAQVTDQQKCIAAKLKSTGKYSASVAKCLSKQVMTGESSLACVNGAANKLTDKFAAIEGKGSCTVSDLNTPSGLLFETTKVMEAGTSSYETLDPCGSVSDVFTIALTAGQTLLARVVDFDYYFVEAAFQIDCTVDGPFNADDEIVCPFGGGGFGTFCPEYSFTATADETCTISVTGYCFTPVGDYRLYVSVDGLPAVVSLTADDQ